MKLHLTRRIYTTRSTIGELRVDGKFQCHVLEDPVRPAKIKGITAIPAGTYRVIISWSARFRQRMPLLEDVPGFEGIRIHTGNTPEHTEGCLLVGKTKATDSVGTSREAYRALFALLEAETGAGRRVEIEITEGGVSPFMAEVAGPPPEKDALFIVQADPLRLRSAPDTADASNITGRLPFGLAVSATGGSAPAGWVEVEGTTGGGPFRGFVARAYLEAVPKAVVVADAAVVPVPVPAPLFRVAVCGLNLRSEPAVLTDETILASLEKDQLVTKLAATEFPMWWQIAAVIHGETRNGFVNAGFLTPDSPVAPVNPDCPAPPATGELAISEKALQLILDFEGMDQPSCWPGQQSGISLGHGYDLGYHTHDDLMGDWGDHLPAAHLRRLACCIGKRGQAAKALAPNFRDIRVSKTAAGAVFMSCTVPKIRLWALKTFPGILALPPDAQGALTSLVYNRGTSMTGDRRREMRAIRESVADAALSMREKLDRIAGQLRAMKRVWPSNAPSSGHPGIRRRREAEAALVQESAPPPGAPRGLERGLPDRAPPPGRPLDPAFLRHEFSRQRDALAAVAAMAGKKDRQTLAALRQHRITPAKLAHVLAALDETMAMAGEEGFPPLTPVVCGLQAGLAALAPGEPEPDAVAGFAENFGGLFSRRHRFNSQPARPAIARKPLSLFLLCGWGSGLPAAAAVAAQVSDQLGTGATARRQRHVIHLGGVHFAGRPEEYRERVLAPWPGRAVAGRAIGSWCLNGDRDMATGGRGYFGTLLQAGFLKRWHADRAGKPSSFFLIEDRHWQVFGLDTAWDGGRLTRAQVRWLARVRDSAKGCILLTHHQPAAALEMLREAGVWPRIDAWICGGSHPGAACFQPAPDGEPQVLWQSDGCGFARIDTAPGHFELHVFAAGGGVSSTTVHRSPPATA